ncbi:hypothetical protein HF263_03045 [Rhizobium leguminosarum]|uniref:hypothetical protein n=1 Tax=Rhizobium leguminosarum TaxID=384 RepID=UPI001C91005C|nr:hypothetical protein [Rhizobium leguminosarum]MBY3055055.1 hypothetical protein [Rhizobium leguminosarum]
MKPRRTLSERIADADDRGGRYLADANEAAERGDTAKAGKLYEKVQYWLDLSNKLRGNA